MPDSVLDEIEDKYGFALPKLYRTIVDNNWVTYRGNERNYLYLYEAEWMPTEEIRDHEREDYHKPGFVPFAFNGAGDHYCWWPEAVHEYGVPIVECPHDYERATVFAPNFLGFVYRNILHLAAHHYDPDHDKYSRDLLRDYDRRLTPLLPEPWGNMIRSLVARPAVTRTMTSPNGQHSWAWTGLIPEDELAHLVSTSLSYPDLDREFTWML